MVSKLFISRSFSNIIQELKSNSISDTEIPQPFPKRQAFCVCQRGEDADRSECAIVFDSGAVLGECRGLALPKLNKAPLLERMIQGDLAEHRLDNAAIADFVQDPHTLEDGNVAGVESRSLEEPLGSRFIHKIIVR